ncbi:MAG TPA: aminotransferase class III-fold pyridoxal phosphate-dependent enzyme, partial [Solirubrobacteraceae bacterium]|nr:aminotransferase class III-fold pyridoxal phosphate-dependent enzyme [Solirubrobacteraceae bacterium]
MTGAPRPDLGELIAARAGEAMELNQRYLNRQLGRVVQTLGFDREWVHGRGEFLIDAAGEEYLDLYAGYGVFSLGRNHPVVREQLMSVMAAEPANLPQIGVTTLAGVLAEELVRRSSDPIDACVLCSSGTEAVEAALKLARAATGRSRVVYCERAFHGLTLGSLSVNGNAEFRDRFGELLPGFAAVPFGDLDALSAALAGGDVAAFIVEPIQGKGVYVAPDGYLAAAGELCRAAGTLLIVDEVQTGLGRTGSFLCLEQWPDVRPDMVTLSKALSGGFVPVGATLC